MTHMLLCHGGVLKNKAMSRMQQVATYWSACVHDHEHGGLNNDFLVKTRHPLALTYNDQSPLENHHVASASKLICQPEYQYLPVSFLLSLLMSLKFCRICAIACNCETNSSRLDHSFWEAASIVTCKITLHLTST